MSYQQGVACFKSEICDLFLWDIESYQSTGNNEGEEGGVESRGEKREDYLSKSHFTNSSEAARKF